MPNLISTEPTFDFPPPDKPQHNPFMRVMVDAIIAMPVGSSIFLAVSLKERYAIGGSLRHRCKSSIGGCLAWRNATHENVHGSRVWKLKEIPCPQPTPCPAGQTNGTSTSASAEK